MQVIRRKIVEGSRSSQFARVALITQSTQRRRDSKAHSYASCSRSRDSPQARAQLISQDTTDSEAHSAVIRGGAVDLSLSSHGRVDCSARHNTGRDDGSSSKCECDIRADSRGLIDHHPRARGSTAHPGHTRGRRRRKEACEVIREGIRHLLAQVSHGVVHCSAQTNNGSQDGRDSYA